MHKHIFLYFHHLITDDLIIQDIAETDKEEPQTKYDEMAKDLKTKEKPVRTIVINGLKITVKHQLMALKT